MSWVNAAMITVASLIGGALLVAPGQAAAGIVVASSGPSAKDFPVGRKLPDTATIVLEAGDSITILDKQGAKVLRGPETIVLGEATGPKRESTFAAFTRLRSASRVRTGAVRGEEAVAEIRSPNLWYLDVTRVGRTCVPDPDAVRLWRPDTASAQSYSVRTVSGATVTIDFEKGAMVAPWDAIQAPVSEGSTFTIRRQGSSREEPISFAILPEIPGNPEDLAELLIERGCMVQLELLARTLGPSTR